MAEKTVRVTEKMASFVEWVYAQGQENVLRLVHERLAMLKEECARLGGAKDSDGFRWNDLLEPSEKPEQWKGGGDCNLCRRQPYCLKQCRANRLLKAVITPFLYGLYAEANPDVTMAEAAKVLTPEMLIKKLRAEADADDSDPGDAEGVQAGV